MFKSVTFNVGSQSIESGQGPNARPNFAGTIEYERCDKCGRFYIAKDKSDLGEFLNVCNCYMTSVNLPGEPFGDFSSAVSTEIYVPLEFHFDRDGATPSRKNDE